MEKIKNLAEYHGLGKLFNAMKVASEVKKMFRKVRTQQKNIN